MTIIDKLIAYYDEHIPIIEKLETAAKTYKYLFDNNLENGVCFVARRVFLECICAEDWVIRHKSAESEYWTNPPRYVLHSKTIMLEALKFRLNKLKEIKANENT